MSTCQPNQFEKLFQKLRIINSARNIIVPSLENVGISKRISRLYSLDWLKIPRGISRRTFWSYHVKGKNNQTVSAQRLELFWLSWNRPKPKVWPPTQYFSNKGHVCFWSIKSYIGFGFYEKMRNQKMCEIKAI